MLSSRPGARLRKRQKPHPTVWLMASFCIFLAVVIIAMVTILWSFLKQPVQAENSPESDSMETAPVHNSVFCPLPTLEMVQSPPLPFESALPSADAACISDLPVPSIDPDAWFMDAAFIGDSRVSGLRLYSGITAKAVFLDHTGLSIYNVAKGKAVIRRGAGKASVLDVLSLGKYGKVYLSVGVNELGYFNPAGFAETYGRVIDAVRACQPDARIYVQLLIPVNTKQCSSSGIPYYITNEGVSDYNAALTELCAEKDVILLGVPDDLLDESGELSGDLTTDGVHFKTEGYVLWLDYLIAHTEG